MSIYTKFRMSENIYCTFPGMLMDSKDSKVSLDISWSMDHINDKKSDLLIIKVKYLRFKRGKRVLFLDFLIGKF